LSTPSSLTTLHSDSSFTSIGSFLGLIERYGGHLFAHAEVEGILTRKTFFGCHRVIGILNAGFSKTFEVDPFGKAPLVPQVADVK
jgi:hypothetical protein